MNPLGQIQQIEEIKNFEISPVAPLEGSSGVRAGMSQMISMLLGGGSSYDGWKVSTDKHVFLVLIDNGQSCCESWGYASTEDDPFQYIGSSLLEVRTTDKALNTHIVEKTGCAEYGFEEGGIQFVDFVTDRGVFQLAVYNSHNGYYGHGILVAKDEQILLNDTL